MSPTFTDPVCDMVVDPQGAITQEHEGQAYYFCEPVCRDTFNDEPERWARPEPVPRGSVEATVAPAAS